MHDKAVAVYNILGTLSVYEAFVETKRLRLDLAQPENELSARLRSVRALIEELDGDDLCALLSDPAIALLLARWFPSRVSAWIDCVPQEDRRRAISALSSAAKILVDMVDPKNEGFKS